MTTETAVSDKRVMKTMGELFGIEGAGAKAPWPVALVPHPMTPKSNVLYLFREDLLRKVLQVSATGNMCRSKLLAGAVIITPISSSSGIWVMRVSQRRRITSAAPISNVITT